MMIVLVLLHIFVCLFLVVVILLQAGRGQGLSWGVFGGSPQSILGTKTTSFLTRLTTACAIIFLFTCIGLNTQVDFQKIKDALEKAKDAEPAQDAEPKSATDHGEAPDEKAPALPPQADPS